jgi:hypothetical protein
MMSLFQKQHAISARFEPVCANAIIGGLFAIRVMTAVQLDDESCGRAIEVNNVWPDGLLPVETQTFKSLVAQDSPEPALHDRGVLPELLCKLCAHHPSPKNAAHFSTLPQGEGRDVANSAGNSFSQTAEKNI